MLKSFFSTLNTVSRKMFQPHVIFVLGGPGAGKGTQCEKITNVRIFFKSVF